MRKILPVMLMMAMLVMTVSCSGKTEPGTTVTVTEEVTTAAETLTVEESQSVTFSELLETTLDQLTTKITTKTESTTKPTTTKLTTTKPTTTKPTTTTQPVTSRPSTGILSDFDSWDLYGNDVDESIFKGKKLTMVNIWATYCSPCINEMPALGEINRAYSSKGFQIVGIITDLHSESAYYTAEDIIRQTGADYTHVALSEDLLPIVNSLSSAVPTTIFVDENGVQVGEVYIGSRSKSEWLKIIDSLLAQV